MQQMIVVEIAGGGERIDQGEGGFRAFHHGNCHSPVERHDGRGLESFKKTVEADNLRPVRIFGTRCLAMYRRDRRLDSEGAGPAAERLLNQWQRLGDLSLIPTKP